MARLPEASGQTPWKSRESKGSAPAEPSSRRLPKATGKYKKMGSGSGKPWGIRLPRATS